MASRVPLGERKSGGATSVWVLVGFFVLNLIGMIATVVVNSFGTRWFSTWLPSGYTTRWYSLAWNEFQLPSILLVTLQVVGAVVVLSGLIGLPAAYAMARREIPGKRAVMLLFLLPLMVPPITYGIPMATVLYQAHLAGSIWGVILANLVPTVPFVVLIMIPFVEQIDPRAWRPPLGVFGAGIGRLFIQVLVPLLTPGILAAMLLVLVRTVAMFELTFLTSGPTSQTLVVALYYAVFAAGVPAGTVGGCDGGGLHDHHVDLAADRAAARQPDADRRAREAIEGLRVNLSPQSTARPASTDRHPSPQLQGAYG